MTTLNVLVVGANRGIGLNIVKAYTRRYCTVTGTIRPQSKDDPSVEELKETGTTILELNYLDEDSIKKAAADYGDRPLDVLVNVGGLPPFPRGWEDQTSEMMVEKFRTMAVGPFLTAKHFLPMLEKAHQPKVVDISSRLGSISANPSGEYMAYRTAKAALNQTMVTLAREWKKEGRNVTIICMEPGWVATRLTQFTGQIDMETSVSGMIRVIDAITYEKDNGAFYKWDGTKVPF